MTHGHCHLELAFAVIHKTVSRSVEAFISLVVCSVALWHSTVHTSSDSCHRHRVYMRFHYVKHTHTQLYVMFIRILGAPTANVSGSNFSPQSHPRVDFTTVTSGPWSLAMLVPASLLFLPDLVLSATYVCRKSNYSSHSIPFSQRLEESWLFNFDSYDHIAQPSLCSQEKAALTMTSGWPLMLLLLSHAHTHMRIHWHSWPGAAADVGKFVLWDKSCFIGTDYGFILCLKTLANITLHTDAPHWRGESQTERVKTN